jgi:hypothetical protein
MCHRCLASRDAGYFNPGVILSVTCLTAVVFAPLELDNADFVAPPMLDDSGGDFRTGDDRGTDFDIVTVPQHEYFRELDLGTWGRIETFDIEFIAVADVVLLTAGLDYEIHELA